MAQDQHNSDVYCSLLLSAKRYFLAGKFRQSDELLNQVKFEQFDVKQWVVENNKLVIKYLESFSFGDTNTVAMVQEFGTLLEKIQGLACSDVLSLELHVAFNYSLAVLATNATEAKPVPGGYNISQMKLEQAIERVCKNVDPHPRHDQLSLLDKLQYFWQCDKHDKKKGEIADTLAWSCWGLAMFYLIDCQVTEAKPLIELIVNFSKEKLMMETTTTGGQQSYNEHLFSIIKEVVVVDPQNSKGTQLLIPTCHLLLCYASFLEKNFDEALKQCKICLKTQPKFVPGLLFKGLILYTKGDVCEALQPLQQVVQWSDEAGYKATALNLLGGHLEALFNIALLYHQLENFDLEVSVWSYVLKILVQRSSNACGPSGRQINVEFVFGVTARVLSDVVFEDSLLISTDIYCVQRNELRNPLLSLHFARNKIARSCLQQKRFSEAAQYFVDLLALLADKPVDLPKMGISSVSEIFKDCAEALNKSGRHEDVLTVCEKILLQGTGLSSSQRLETTPKRPQHILEESEDLEQSGIKTLIHIMLFKAEALAQLRRPVEAYECYELILEELNKKFWDACDCIKLETNSEKPDHKRQRTEAGPKGIHQCDPKSRRNVQECEKLRALTLNNQALLLKSLGRNKEALLLLTQSIACQPDCVRYHYNHASLLFDMGQDKEAAQNWLRVRNLDPASGSAPPRRKDFDEDEQSLFLAMDSRAERIHPTNAQKFDP